MATTHNHGPASLKRARGASFPPGRGKPPGSGRKPGVQNVTSRNVREMIIEATRRIGGIERLIAWIQESERNELIWWSQIWPRLLPLQIRGPGPGGALEVNVAIDPSELMRKLQERNLPTTIFGADVPEPAEMKLIDHNGCVTNGNGHDHPAGDTVTVIDDGDGSGA
jgi:hypothetical protein